MLLLLRFNEALRLALQRLNLIFLGTTEVELVLSSPRLAWGVGRRGICSSKAWLVKLSEVAEELEEEQVVDFTLNHPPLELQQFAIQIWVAIALTIAKL
jgi:hypothetical protein